MKELIEKTNNIVLTYCDKTKQFNYTENQKVLIDKLCENVIKRLTVIDIINAINKLELFPSDRERVFVSKLILVIDKIAKEITSNKEWEPIMCHGVNLMTKLKIRILTETGVVP